MPNQGHKLRTFRANDDYYHKFQYLIKSLGCIYTSDFVKQLVDGNLIIVKKSSLPLDRC